MTSLLTEGLVARGQDVTLFATADSTTRATLSAIYAHGYWHDENMWPWELYEMLNLAAAVERAREFDIIHYEAAYYPMSLAFTRCRRRPSCRRCIIRRAQPGPLGAVSSAVRRHLGASRRAAHGRQRDRHVTHGRRHRQLHVLRSAWRLPLPSTGSPNGRPPGHRNRQARRHEAGAGGGRDDYYRDKVARA
jgi:hypothetical protein